MFSMLDPRDLPNYPPFKELNNDINLLSEVLSKGAINDKDAISLTALIRKIADIHNKPLFGNTQTNQFTQLIKTLEALYPKVYEQIKTSFQNDSYIRTTFFGEPAQRVPSPPITNPSIAKAQATTTQATVALAKPLLAPAPLVFPPEKAEIADKLIEEGDLTKLQELCKQIDPNLLLLKAFELGNGSVCRWLLKNPAIEKRTLDALPQQKTEQLEMKKWLLAFVEVGPVTPVTLRKLAMEQGYGFKSGNLMVLKAMGEALNKAVNSTGAPVLTKCQVQVPSFIPVSNFEVTQHILKHDPEIMELWEKCKKSFKEDQVKAFLASKQPASEQMDVTDGGRTLLKQIGERMELLFKNHPLKTPEMQEWLRTNEGKPIIVRSTGKEDSDELANAGGNESIPFVKPDITSLNNAMGRVIGSYFCDPNTKEPRSIQQRLAAGDKTIFTEAPFMPVLLQQMVMEDPKDSKTLLRSGVLFSRPQSEFSDAVLIQTGLGNNHGIVTSEVTVDTYTVENQRVQAVVRDKSTRFVHAQSAAGGFSLQLLENDRSIATTQALSEGAVKDLAATATHIAKIYGGGNQKKSMDMEYSIQIDPKTGKQTIYLLQARPLMDTEGDMRHPKTYLDLKTLYDVSKKNPVDAVKGKTLLDGNSHVRSITSSKQVIMADELATALQSYLSAPDRKEIKAIIIKRKAVLTSHEAVTLRPMGVPVIIIDNENAFEKTRTLLGNASNASPTLLCPQRAVVVSTKNVAAYVRNGFIKNGLVTYPGALETSVPVNKDLAKAVQTKDKAGMSAYLKGMEARYEFIMHKLAKSGEGPDMHDNDEFSIKQLIDLVATGSKAQAETALRGILSALHTQLGALKAGANQMAAFEMLATFSAILEQVDRRILPSLTKTQPSSMERLYHLKPLDALIFQSASTEVVNGFSFSSALTVQATAKKLETAAKSAGPMRPEVTALTLHYKNALSLQFGDKWIAFIQNLENASPPRVHELYKMVKTLDQLQMTSLWMGMNTASFDPAKPIKTFTELKQHYETNLKTFVWLKTESQTVEHLEQTADQWVDPAFFEKQIASLTKTYNNWFTPAKNCLIKQKFEASGPLGKLATLQFLGRTVNAFDHIIKAMKGSDRYKDDKKLKLFAQLLKTYHQMMVETFTLVPESLEDKLMPSIYNVEYGFKRYKDAILLGGGSEADTSEGFDSLCVFANSGMTSPAEQFVSRSNFNVASITIGSNSYFPYAIFPTTLEEYFTTFHQNMEVAKNALSYTLGLGKEALSPRAQEIVGQIEIKFDTKISTISFKDGRVIIEFNIPLREHASAVCLSYDPMDPQERLEIGVAAYGNDEHDRWDLLSGAIVLMGQSQPGISLTQIPKINYKAPRGTEVTLGLDKTFKSAPQLVDELQWLLNKMTFDALSTSGGVIDHLKSNNLYSSNQLSISTLSHAPGMLNSIMQKALETNDTPLALRAAFAALIGTAQRETESYGNRVDASQFSRAWSFPKGLGYPAIVNNTLLANSALKCLLELLDQMKISSIDLEPLFADKNVQKSHPKLLSDLKEALKFYAAAKDKISLLIASKQHLQAIQLLKFVKGQSDHENCASQINAALDEVAKVVNTDEFLKEIYQLNNVQRKETVNFLKHYKRLDILTPLSPKIDFFEQMLTLKIGPKIPLDTSALSQIVLLKSADNKFFKNSADYLYSKYLKQTTFEAESISDSNLDEQLDAKLSSEPFQSLIPKTNVEYSLMDTNRNGFSMVLLGFIEGLMSTDAAIKAEAAAQIKLLKSQIEQADKIEALFATPNPFDFRLGWKKSIDAIITHFQL